ncbi:tyrosine-type recombinase/integrase, partial [Escherichia coli]|uniref:tyrosine-type recombinase/integrase n=1 Tax=Escherichia coli TaxID=562 RepID=UPI003CF0025E
GIQRKSSESKCLKANASDFDKVQNEIANSRSPQKEIIMNIHQIQRGVGCRIHEVVKMKGEDITFNSNGSATVYIKGKGGLERWVHVDDKKTIELLKEQTKDKKDGAYVFPLKNKEGNDKNLSSSMKLAKDVIRSAAERSGVDRDEKTYSTHSARKVY